MKLEQAQKMVGETVQFYPGDTFRKYGRILGVDDAGWLLEVMRVEAGSGKDGWVTGQTRFISHSKSLTFATVPAHEAQAA